MMSRKNKVGIPEATYKLVVFGLIQALTQTGLEIMARVLPEDTLGETRLRSYYEEMTKHKMFTI